jgi:uncharacterized protein (TIRG00374 family)
VNKLVKIILSFGISIGLILYLALHIEWSSLTQELQSAKITPIIISGLLWILHFFVRAIRWQYLLNKDFKTSLLVRFESIMIGVFATFILPLRAGEFIRPLYLSKFSEVNFTQGFVSVFIERFFDLLCVLLMFAIITPYLPSMPDWMNKGAIAFGILAFGILIFLICALLIPNQIKNIVSKVTKIFPNFISQIINKISSDLIIGASSIGTFNRMISILFLTLVIWILNIAIFHLFMGTVSLIPELKISTALTVMIALAVAAPSAPGFIGVYQVATVACFAMFGISAEKAAAFSILSHAQQYLIYSTIGIYILVKRGISMGQLSSSPKK